MRVGNRRCLLCSCENTMQVDTTAIADALQADEPALLHHQLCRAELGKLQSAIDNGGKFLIACRQEEALFAEIAERSENPVDIRTVDIRSPAGWSSENDAATPKMAALIAQALLPVPNVATVTMESQGRCLVLGGADQAVEVATRLASVLDVTIVFAGGDILPPARRDLTILRGQIERLSGHLGQFNAEFTNIALPLPSARDNLDFGAPRTELKADFDCVLDLRGATPLVQAPEKRDGYLRPDPGDPLAVERALFDIAQLSGQFEKPRYVDLDESLCAHSRSGKIGCSRCLIHCPTGAISPAGDHVAIDAYVCAGCGSCAALCPSGAITYNNPTANHMSERLRALLTIYAKAGGKRAQIFVHDRRHGEPLIDAIARYGDGLPANVLPLEIDEVTQISLEVLLSAFAYGAQSLVALLPHKAASDALALDANITYANAVLEGLGYGIGRIGIVFEDDPDALAERLWDRPDDDHDKVCQSRFLALGGKRERLRLALEALHAEAPHKVSLIKLPADAPIGNVDIDKEGCTLCLACVGACPTGALIDNPDLPMLRFLEDACIQCGLCQQTCPEGVITLEPRVNFDNEAKSLRLIKEEDPCLCTRCGRAFGTKSSVEKIVAKLATKHSMFQNAEQIARLRMCDDCRVAVQFEATDNPFQAGPRPRTKTTDDYLREREEIEAARARHKG